jgi:YVTN family beta-propeller protein
MRHGSSWTRREALSTATRIALVLAAALALAGAPASASATTAGAHGRWLGSGLGSPLAWGGGRLDATSPHAWTPSSASVWRQSVPGTAPTVAVGGNPVGVAVDPATHTVYVANGTDNTVSVINAANCNAANISGCSQTPPTVAVGGGPLSLALDKRTRTLYVTNLFGSSVSMIDAATCNATDTSGCDQTPPVVAVGSGPGLLAIDKATNTIYVPNGNDGTVSVIDGATCNATETSGCAFTSTVAAGPGAGAVALNERTHTAYVANFNNDNASTVSVIDIATCNAANTSGCGQTPATVAVGAGPSALVVDQASNTVYVAFGATDSLGSVALINGATCNAAVTAGCAQAPRATPVGEGPEWVAENAATHTVYVVNQEDSRVSVLDAASCNATDSAGCRQTPSALAIGFNGGGVAVDPTTDTVYATSQNNNTVSMLNGATCNATNTSECTPFAPTTEVGKLPQPIAVDQSTDTVYVGNSSDNTVSVIDAAACSATHPAECDRVWPTIKVGASPFFGLAIDHQTNTLYVTNINDNTVSVINTATCNAHTNSGCGQSPPTIAVGHAPAGVAIDERTHTVYVANVGDNTVSVINAAICNAHVASGCDQTAPTVAAGNGPVPVALNDATDTLYVANQGDDTVSVINAAICNAQYSSGCNQTPPTVAVNDSPYGLAVDEHTNTVYVANTGNEIFQTPYANLTSSVSIIHGAACNASQTSGCGQTPTSVPVGGLPWDVAVDPATNAVYVTSIVDSDVAVINGAACNGQITSDCRPRVIPAKTGGWPSDIGLDPASGTMYVTDNVDGAMSLFRLRRR